jgi:putative component of toxin-antitoxin plasmid stabilization module
VNYRIVELEELLGSKAIIYSVIMQGEETTLFDQFITDNLASNSDEISFIINRLAEIGQTTGARDIFFKHNEGKPGDGVCALYDEPKKGLRLYCIRYGNVAIVLGGGGSKRHEISAWKEDVKLTLEAGRMIEISKLLTKRIKEREISWSEDGRELIGNLIFEDDET